MDTHEPKPLTERDCIWITWERQRRTETLSGDLGVRLYRLTPPDNYLWKVLVLSLRTIGILLRVRPRCLIVQNPSMALAGLVALLRPLFGYRLVVDRHSNFKFPTMDDPSPKYRAFHALSRLTISKADLTIVTNDHLAGVVRDWGGRPFVLQDRLPDMDLARETELEGERNVVMVSSFSADEPIDAVLAAAEHLPEGWRLHMTGNWRRRGADLESRVPSSVRLTGFLDEPDFQSLLLSADAVVALTTQDHTLLCSAYEAVVLGRPLVLSDTSALRAYFREGVVFTGHGADDLAAAMIRAVEERDERAAAIRGLRDVLAEEWKPRFRDLVARIEGFAIR